MINCILYTSKNKNKNLNDISRALKNIWVCGVGEMMSYPRHS
jgi:hypothetical protein